MRRAVCLWLAALVCSSLILVRGEAPWGSIAANVGISVPRGSFADTAVGATFTTSDASGGVFRVEPLAAAPTECALGDYSYNGVAFRFTRVDTGVTLLPFRVDINLNTTMANLDGMQTFVPFGHGLYACLDDAWVPLHTLYCTNPVSPSVTPTRYLSTSTCRTNLTVALLYDRCGDDIPYNDRTKAIQFLRTCHKCVDGNGFDFRGCKCEVNSTDDYDTNGVVIAMATMTALAFALVCYLRYRLMSAEKVSHPTWIWMIGVAYAILGTFIIARLFGAYDGRDTTTLTATGFTVLRTIAALAMVPLFVFQVSSHLRNAVTGSKYVKDNGNIGRGSMGLAVLVLIGLLFAANACLLLAPAFPAYFAHVHNRPYPTEWVLMVVVVLVFVAFQEAMMWVWVFNDYPKWGWNTHRWLWVFYATAAVFTAVLWGMTSARLPCE